MYLIFKITPFFFSVFLMFLSVLSISAQNDSSGKMNLNEALSYRLTLQHTTIVVSDISKSEKFYKDILKLEDLNATWLPKNQIFLSLGDNLELHVGEVPGVQINPSNFNHFALSVNDLDTFLEYLKDKGVMYSSLGGEHKYKVQKRPDGVRQTFIQDPDGYWIEINDAH